MTQEMDSRREKLEARRYHVDLRMDDGDGCIRSGEFFYDSLPASRRFIRQQFADWGWCYGLGGNITPEDWKLAWKRGALKVTLREEGGRNSLFEATVRDTATEATGESDPLWIEFDFTEEARRRYEEEALKQEEA